MNIKKLLSLLLTAGIMATSLSTAVYATTNPKVIVDITEYDENNLGVFEGSYDTAESLGIPEGGTAYLLEYKLANVNLGYYKSGSTVHNRLGTLQVFYDITNSSNIQEVKTEWFTAEASDANDAWAGDEGFYGASVFVASYSGSSIWPTGNTASADYTEEEPTPAIFNYVVIVKDKNVPVILTPKATQQVGAEGLDETMLKLAAFKGNTAQAASDVTHYPAGNIKDVEATLNVETITLGEAPAATVTSIDIAADSDAVMAVDGTKTLTATVKDENGNAMAGETVTWSSSSDVATVDGGVVTAVKPGKATITATSTTDTNVKATYEVKVLPQVAICEAAEYTKDEVKYVIWKNISITGSNWGTAYEVTFSTASDSITKDLSLGSAEVGGNCSFPMLLKTANTGVGAEINCTWTDAQ